jgi:hypothetical protein
MKACALSSDLSVLDALPGATPDPPLAHPHCGLSRVVHLHAPRQTLFRFSRHTVRHHGWHPEAAPEFNEIISARALPGAAKEQIRVLPLRGRETHSDSKNGELTTIPQVFGCFPKFRIF